MQSIEFNTADGYALQGALFGDPATCKAALLIVSAMGVPQRFYSDFAQWLATQGYAVFTFDYRGIGASRPTHMRRSLRGLQADVVAHVTAGGDALVLMPTGGGKSLCYQVPAIARHRAARGVAVLRFDLVPDKFGRSGDHGLAGADGQVAE